ncbi:MAG: pimeloyl-ACP methyl ester carboxylesterase [Arcticibacterium sp.]|jgi:pimeloyl-ACP methyl ester carboxylesterase
MSDKIKPGSDLQGLTRLITDATVGITDLVEAMHRRVVHPPLLPSTPIQHLISSIAGFTYKNIKWSTKFIGGSLEKALELLAPRLGEIKSTDELEAIRSVLNGVVGDYLEEKKNPLEINMQFRLEGKTINVSRKGLKTAYPNINGKILLMIHGSCMNDVQWTRKGHNHGELLAKELRKTRLYLQYNSGRHVSTNGQDLSTLLEDLIAYWPVAIESIEILAHSMGGLVSRSALYYGKQEKKIWTKHLQKVVFLGTPHHGAPLEKAGNYIDIILEAIPYAKPFARLGKIRSAGITDLRYGNLIDEDWQAHERFKPIGDQRQYIPLLRPVDFYNVAAILGKKKDTIGPRIIGDGMVGIKSALGEHKNAKKTLHFKKKNTFVIYESGHLDLLSSPEVYAIIKGFLG